MSREQKEAYERKPYLDLLLHGLYLNTQHIFVWQLSFDEKLEILTQMLVRSIYSYIYQSRCTCALRVDIVSC